MYYDYPEAEEAYSFKQQFMFGGDILATTVCQPLDSTTVLAGREMWFPAGNDWYDASTGTTYKGGQKARLTYTIFENPYFVKSGSIIPMAMPNIESLQQTSSDICLWVAPGDGNSQARFYEDDGSTQAYETEYAYTTISKTSDASSFNMTVGGRKGGYRNAPDQRTIRIVLDGVLPAEKVSVGGVEIPYSRFPKEHEGNSVWTYDGASLQLIVYLAPASANEAINVAVAYPASNAADRALADGKKGLLRRITSLSEEGKFMYATYVNGWKQMPMGFIKAAGTGSHITEYPENAAEYLRSLDLKAAYEPFDTDRVPESFKNKLAAWLGINRESLSLRL